MSAPREAALSSFAAPSIGNRSKSKSSHVRVVARIRPMHHQEKETGIAVLEPIDLPSEVPQPPELQHSSPPRSAARKGPFKFLTPKKRNGKPPSTPQRNDDATPVIRNSQRAPSPGRRPPVSSSTPTEYGTAKSLLANDRQFDFDAVFAQEATQKEVYDRSVGDAVRRNIFRGYNTTIIAYGQTGAGKTYTMGGKHDAELANRVDMAEVSPTNSSSSSKSFMGIRKSNSSKSVNSLFKSAEESTYVIDEDDGIIPRAVHDLFKAKQRHESAGQVSIQLTFLEIYNDELRDLLVDGGDECMKLCDQGDDGVVVKGLTTITVKSTEQVRQVMEAAAKRRTTASTKMNMRSSRSHAICTLLVTIDPAITSSGSNSNMSTRAEVISAKLTLVDLAGSERIKETGVVGLHQQESIAINQDLFVLGKVILSLAEKTKASRTNVHVPYRDSKLTRLLRDSLGGNCCTVMVACVSPTNKNLDESINTLRYAERARTITNAVKQNVVKAVMTPAECAAMRGENKMLKSKVQQLAKHVSLLKQKMEDADTLSEESNFTMDDLSLGASVLEERDASKTGSMTTTESISKSESTDKTESMMDAQLDAKNLALMSLDLEIHEKKEIVEKLRAEATDLEAMIAKSVSVKTQSATSRGSSLAAPHPQAIAAPGTKIEMVTLSNSYKEELEQQSRQHAKAIRVLEDKVQSLVQVNGGLRHELTVQRQRLESRQEEEKDNQEKIDALILQLGFEQKRIVEHEASLKTTQQDLRNAVEERDGYRMKIAIQADEIAKRDTEISLLKKQVEEMGKLRFALSFSEQQVDQLRKTIRALESERLARSVALNEVEASSSSPNGVLTARNPNVEATNPEDGAKDSNKPFDPKSAPNENTASIHNANPMDCDSSFDTTGNDSEDSDHKAIRLQAAKMLFFANKAIERGRDSRSVCSSMASSNGSEFKPEMSKIRSMINESSGKTQRVSSALLFPKGRPPTPRGKPPRAGGSKRSPTKPPLVDENDGPVISNIDQISSMNDCLCSKDPEYVNFFLPKLGATCSCGGENNAKDLSMTEGDDPLALANILRDWQVDFLHSLDINTAKELVTVYNLKGNILAKEMRKWRRKHRLVSVKTVSCGVALHIWARTCKAVIKSVQQQIAGGAKIVKRPAILEVAWTSDNNTAVSSLGSSLAEF